MGVIEKAKKGWHGWQLFKEIEPGHRFQTRYNNHRQRRERGETSRYGRIFNLVGGPRSSSRASRSCPRRVPPTSSSS
jgi:hypothetical protein